MTTASMRIADRYELVAPVGRGGSGTVWRARDGVLDREVAVKQVRLPSSLPADEHDRLRERVLREARAAAGLTHPNVVTVHDVIEEDGDVFIVMEFVPAPTLADIIDVRGPLDEAEVAALGVATLDALEAAHASGIVHRDVKPSNVIVVGEGDVRLTDFGIAAVPDDPTLTRAGIVLGSPAYIAPEQVRGEDVGVAADLWGLGATLYHAVEGAAPFTGGDDVDTVEAVADSPPRPLERAEDLASLLRDLLRKDPSARPRPEQVRERLVTVVGDGDADETGTGEGDDETPERSESTAEPAPTHSFDALDEVETPDATPAGSAAAIASGPVDGTGSDTPGNGDVQYRFDDTATADAPLDVGDDTRPLAGAGSWGTKQTGDSSGRSRRLLLAAGILVAMVAVAAALVILPGPVEERRTEQTGASSPQAANTAQAPAGERAAESPPATDGEATTAPSETPSDGTSESAGAGVPDDWVVSEGDTYRVAHPPGWQAEQVTGNTTQYRDPETRTYIRVTREGEQRDPVAEWESYSDQFAAQHDGYEEIRIEPYEVKGREGAIWEYRYEAGGAALHAVNIKIPVDGRGYAFNLQSHAGNWGEVSQQLDAFLAGFQPTE